MTSIDVVDQQLGLGTTSHRSRLDLRSIRLMGLPAAPAMRAACRRHCPRPVQRLAAAGASRRGPDWHANTLADIAIHLLKRRVAERRPERAFNTRRQAVAEPALCGKKIARLSAAAGRVGRIRRSELQPRRRFAAPRMSGDAPGGEGRRTSFGAGGAAHTTRCDVPNGKTLPARSDVDARTRFSTAAVTDFARYGHAVMEAMLAGWPGPNSSAFAGSARLPALRACRQPAGPL